MINDISKIGDSDFRFNIPYIVKDKSKIPFGSHVSEKEIEDCKSITFIYSCHKHVSYFPYDKDTVYYELGVDFFIDSRPYGIGGTIKHVNNVQTSELKTAKAVLLAYASNILSYIDLEIDSKAIVKMIKDLDKHKEELDAKRAILVDYIRDNYMELIGFEKEA